MWARLKRWWLDFPWVSRVCFGISAAVFVFLVALTWTLMGWWHGLTLAVLIPAVLLGLIAIVFWLERIDPTKPRVRPRREDDTWLN